MAFLSLEYVTCNKAQVNMSSHQLCYRTLMFKTAVCTVFWLLVTEDKNYVLPRARIQILSRDSASPWIKQYTKFRLVSWHEPLSFFFFFLNYFIIFPHWVKWELWFGFGLLFLAHEILSFRFENLIQIYSDRMPLYKVRPEPFFFIFFFDLFLTLTLYIAVQLCSHIPLFGGFLQEMCTKMTVVPSCPLVCTIL